jgi:predicted amidophosphoribosyltransferase
VGLPRQARIDNLRGAFQLRRGANVPEVVILFDDVLTTGTTASRCALALKRGGARVVAVVALARS